MIFGSVCSGIEGASVATAELGWNAQWFFEIHPFCCELLRQKYPDVPNHGNIIKNANKATAVDVVIGGTPCQPFSITGNRRGMDDPRGNTTLAYLSVIRKAKPRWIVWENVPGILTLNRGRDFGQFICGLAELGYLGAWRVFDVSAFGVPQRRRRLFVVGYRGACQPGFAVLVNALSTWPAGTATEEVSCSTVARTYGDGDGWTGDETPKRQCQACPTIRASQGGEGTGIVQGGRLRKLTSREMERLQGVPDDYTAIAINGKPASYKQRQFVLGNCFTVPAIRWIAERIQFLTENT